MNRYRDEFDDEPGIFKGENIMSLLSMGGRGFAAGAIFAALILLGLVIWIAYPSGDEAGGEVPIIRAESGDYRSAPDEPGGMDIPHRDSTVFSSMGEGNPDGDVENLLADNEAEVPLPKSDLFAGLNTEIEQAPPQPQAEPMTEPVASEDLVPKFENKAANAGEAEIKSIPPQETETQAAIEEEAANAEPAAGAATTAPQAIADGTHFIQLASITDKAKAAAAYKDLQKKYPALANLEYRVETADLGAKGIYYRIQAGPVSKNDADSTCGVIKAQNPGGCLVVAK